MVFPLVDGPTPWRSRGNLGFGHRSGYPSFAYFVLYNLRAMGTKASNYSMYGGDLHQLQFCTGSPGTVIL